MLANGGILGKIVGIPSPLPMEESAQSLAQRLRRERRSLPAAQLAARVPKPRPAPPPPALPYDAAGESTRVAIATYQSTIDSAIALEDALAVAGIKANRSLVARQAVLFATVHWEIMREMVLDGWDCVQEGEVAGTATCLFYAPSLAALDSLVKAAGVSRSLAVRMAIAIAECNKEVFCGVCAKQ